MTPDITSNIAGVIEYALRVQTYVLRLYVSGMTPRSNQSVLNIERVCREELDGKYDLQVIDLERHPVLATDEQIIATSTLIKLLPPPLRRVVGDFSDSDHVLFGMDIKRKADRFDSWKYPKRNPQEQHAKLAE
jgi:circadian clock protein KaiB